MEQHGNNVIVGVLLDQLIAGNNSSKSELGAAIRHFNHNIATIQQSPPGINVSTGGKYWNPVIPLSDRELQLRAAFEVVKGNSPPNDKKDGWCFYDGFNNWLGGADVVEHRLQVLKNLLIQTGIPITQSAYDPSLNGTMRYSWDEIHAAMEGVFQDHKLLTWPSEEEIRLAHEKNTR